MSRKESFTRGDYDSLLAAERDLYPSLILLCKIHHKQIDDQPNHFTVDKLKEIKRLHEDDVKAQWTDKDLLKQQDEVLYASYVDEWRVTAGLDNWRNVSSWVTDEMPAIPREWYDHQKEFLIWIIGRIWPGRHPLLEEAFKNYGAVLQDFLNVFDKYIDWDRKDDSNLHTRRFYKLSDYDPDRYRELGDQYDAHVCLVSDLFFELTRAANLICDRVRENIFAGFRLKEGVLLIERHSVGFGLKTIRARV